MIGRLVNGACNAGKAVANCAASMNPSSAIEKLKLPPVSGAISSAVAGAAYQPPASVGSTFRNLKMMAKSPGLNSGGGSGGGGEIGGGHAPSAPSAASTPLPGGGDS